MSAYPFCRCDDLSSHRASGDDSPLEVTWRRVGDVTEHRVAPPAPRIAEPRAVVRPGLDIDPQVFAILFPSGFAPNSGGQS